jgi:hypothetical protein
MPYSVATIIPTPGNLRNIFGIRLYLSRKNSLKLAIYTRESREITGNNDSRKVGLVSKQPRNIIKCPEGTLHKTTTGIVLQNSYSVQKSMKMLIISIYTQKFRNQGSKDNPDL